MKHSQQHRIEAFLDANAPGWRGNGGPPPPLKPKSIAEQIAEINARYEYNKLRVRKEGIKFERTMGRDPLKGLKREWVVAIREEQELISLGLLDLASKVREYMVKKEEIIMSQKAPVALGYDVPSYYPDGRSKPIEVKPIGSSLTEPEYRYAQNNPDWFLAVVQQDEKTVVMKPLSQVHFREQIIKKYKPFLLEA